MPFQVLCIEDSEADVELIKRALADSDFTVFATATAKMALRFMSTATTDIILLDLTLPNGAGTELVRRVLGKAGTTPVVLLTGSDDEAVVTQAMKDGIAGFVSKNKMNRLELLVAMHLAIKDRKGVSAPDSKTLQLLAEKIQKMKAKGDEAIDMLAKEAGLKEPHP